MSHNQESGEGSYSGDHHRLVTSRRRSDLTAGEGLTAPLRLMADKSLSHTN